MIKFVSLYDIMYCPAGAQLVREGTEQDFLDLLYCLGFDTTKPLERQEVWHRPLTSKTNTPIFGMRFVGQERNDDEWRNSGLRSMEARLDEYRQTDFELFKDMFQASYFHNFTGAVISNMINKGSLLPYYDTISGEELENEDEY